VDGPDALDRVDSAGLAVSGTHAFILDRGNHRVLTVDLSSGRVLARFGHDGRGPFEFHLPTTLWAFQDTVYLFEGVRRTVVSFTADGGHASERPTDRLMTLGYDAEAIRRGPRGLVFAANRYGDTASVSSVLEMNGPDTTHFAEARVPGLRSFDLKSCGMMTRWEDEPVGSIEVAWTAEPWGVAANDTTAYRVDVFGKRRMRVVRGFAERPMTREDALADLKRRFSPTTKRRDGSRCSFDYAGFLDKAGQAETRQQIRALTLSPAGDLWVRRSEADGSKTDVFGPEGDYLGSLPPDSPFPALFAPDGSFLTVARDTLGVEYVVRYTIERGEVAGS
jgi:hypothetical protein